MRSNNVKKEKLNNICTTSFKKMNIKFYTNATTLNDLIYKQYKNLGDSEIPTHSIILINGIKNVT